MTVREITELCGGNPFLFSAVVLAVPILCVLLGLIHGKGRGRFSPWKYFYAIIVYLACVPGIFSAVITAYTLFFTRENLLDVNLLVYFLPVISMIVTLVLISRNVSFDDVPGFDRLWGLMVLIASTFVIALAIQKTRLWVFFGGSLLTLVLFMVGLFLLLKLGGHMLFRRKRRLAGRPPSLDTR